MKTLSAIIVLLATFLAQAEDSWKIVDEGFQLNLPVSWQKQKVQCIDSHCGAYKGSTADLHFDGVVGLGYTIERAQAEINELKKKEADPKLLSGGEEVWYVDGRIASFSIGELDPKVYGTRRFSNVAALRVPDDTGRGSYLSIYIIYESDKDVPTVRRVLRSLEFKRKNPTPGTKEYNKRLLENHAKLTALQQEADWLITPVDWNHVKVEKPLAPNGVGRTMPAPELKEYFRKFTSSSRACSIYCFRKQDHARHSSGN